MPATNPELIVGDKTIPLEEAIRMGRGLFFSPVEEGSLAEKIAQQGIVRDIPYQEVLELDNVLTPKEYSRLRQALILTDNHSILFDVSFRKTGYKGIFRTEEELKENRGIFVRREFSFWTSHGVGSAPEDAPAEYKDKLIMARVKSIDPETGQAVPDYEHAVVLPHLPFKDGWDRVQQIGAWEDLDDEFSVPLLGNVNWEAGFLNNGYRDIVGKFLPITIDNNGSNRMDFSRGSPSYCRYAFTCLNKDGENPEFPSTVGELTHNLLCEYLSDPERAEKSECIRVRRKDRREKVSRGAWQGPDKTKAYFAKFPNISNSCYGSGGGLIRQDDKGHPIF